jgi:hypothetical protein
VNTENDAQPRKWHALREREREIADNGERREMKEDKTERNRES